MKAGLAPALWVALCLPALAQQAAQEPVQQPAQATPSQASSAQPASAAPAPGKPAASPAATISLGAPVKANVLHDQRKAAKLYLEGIKLLEKQQPEPAWKLLKQASELEPANTTYLRAAELARQGTVTQLVQEASRERDHAASSQSAALLKHAQEIDPTNPLVVQHLDQLADGVTGSQAGTTQIGATAVAGQDSDFPLADGGIKLEPNKDKHSFHLHAPERQIVQEVFRAYGIEASVHDSVKSQQVRLDLDDVSFTAAVHALGLVTKTFYEPLDPHRVVVASDTRENRTQFQRTEMETIYLPGLTDKELTDVSNVAKQVFDAQQTSVQPTRGTMTVRASTQNITALNKTIGSLEAGLSQVDLNVKVIQLSHVSTRETGTTFFQQTGVNNAFSEINSIIQQNQSAVQQIISSGLVPNASTFTNEIEIIAVLLSSGQLTGTPFNQGFALFGGGLTSSILSPSPATLTMTLNSSDTRTLDDIHMHLEDDEAGTFKIGERYPIETSSYSSTTLPNIPGVSQAAAALTEQTVPQIQYQDIGLTLKATPRVMRSDDVALTMELKIDSLGGSSLNDIPILDSQQFAGVLTLKEGETAVMFSDLSRQESRALSGLPGVSDIPGLQDVSDITRNQNVARLLILVTPSVVRGTQRRTHDARMPVDKASTAH
jgi:general secretion pathway protein D